MKTEIEEVKFQIWQLSRAITSDWSNATPEGLALLSKMKRNLAIYKNRLRELS
jgi:hypothetical protein